MDATPPDYAVRPDETGQLTLYLTGNWTEGQQPPGTSRLSGMLEKIEPPGPVALDLSGVGEWDSQLPAFCLRWLNLCRARGIDCERRRHGSSLDDLLDLATTTPPREARKRSASWLSPVAIRRNLHEIGEQVQESLAFVGDATLACATCMTPGSSMRWSDLKLYCAQAGPGALPIITLTSVLVGMILAYLGAVQLQDFGAEVYVADLVGIGMLREMGALMTAVVMAGRTGAAYAAQIGTMQGNDEIDALTTLGLSPMEFLVAPRLLALALMMPLLTIYANVLGMVGGAIVAGGMGITPLAYLSELVTVLAPGHFFVGLSKSFLFAVLIAIAGCRAGMSAGRSSAGVGDATTEAVVTAVVYLIIADAGMNILFQQVGV
ncbi:MAG: ABC transporter permease [Chromatocurvus sp.]